MKKVVPGHLLSKLLITLNIISLKIFINVQSFINNIIFADTLHYLDMAIDSGTQLTCNILNCTAYYTEFVK